MDNSAYEAYDELGRLRKRKRHNGTDSEEFDYNIRNWTTRIKSGDFEQKLYYTTSPYNNANFNGNISDYEWTYNGALNYYWFHYDNLNRLEVATNKDLDAGTDKGEMFAYDKMGNIILTRYRDSENPDDLEFFYNGNQVRKINRL